MLGKMIVAPVGFVALLALSACGSGSSTTQTPGTGTGTPVQTGTTSPTPKYSFPPYHPQIDPAKFTDHITNPYLPFKQGTTAVFQGSRDGVPLRIEVTVTKEKKTILGVRCIVVRDIVTGALEERTTDWYAQDTSGNVWYFGEDTKEFKNGAVTSTAGSWEAGVNGALPGIVMYANPKVGPPYRQEYRPGEAEDVAQVVRLGASVHVPAGNYTDVVVTKDTDLLNPAKLEHKYYARGVGLAFLDGTVNGHREIVKLSTILTAK